MPHLMQGEVNDFCEALTKLTKEFGIAIVGKVLIEPLEDHEISEFDFYAPDESHQKIEWSLHVPEKKKVERCPKCGYSMVEYLPGTFICSRIACVSFIEL